MTIVARYAPVLLVLCATTPSVAAPAADPICGTVEPFDKTQSPATLAMMRFANEWMQAIATADDNAYLGFLKARGPGLLGGPEQWLQLRDDLRGVRLCGVKSAGPDMVELWSYDPNWDQYGFMRLKRGASAASKPEFIFLAGTEDVPPGAARPPKLTPAALVAAVRERAAARTATDRFAGAILLAQNGRVLLQQAYGLADRARGKPNTVETQFRFGSMGKMFTAVAIMQLVQDGKVDLQAPIGRYLPGYPNQDVATKVTVANLLTHTGGTGDIFGPEFDANKATLRTLGDYVGLYGKRGPEFAPGTRQSYSNYGFVLLGRIVETVSGLGYDDYIERRIFAPAGMKSTGNQPESVALPRRSVVYMGSGPRLKDATETLPLSGTAAGGGYSTVGDFNRFVDGLTSHKLLRRETLQTLIDGGVKTSDDKVVRYDFGGTMLGVGPFIGHGGGAPGMSGSLQHFLKQRFTIIVLAYRDPGTAESIALFAAHRLPAQ